MLRSRIRSFFFQAGDGIRGAQESRGLGDVYRDRASSPEYFPELDPAHYGFGAEDLARPYMAGDLPGGPLQTLGEIQALLRLPLIHT